MTADGNERAWTGGMGGLAGRGRAGGVVRGEGCGVWGEWTYYHQQLNNS